MQTTWLGCYVSKMEETARNLRGKLEAHGRTETHYMEELWIFMRWTYLLYELNDCYMSFFEMFTF